MRKLMSSIVLVSLGVGQAAMAQESAGGGSAPADTGAPAARSGPPMRITLTPRVNHTFESDFDDADGESSVTRGGADLNILYPMSERLQLTLGLDGEYSWYRFAGRDPDVLGGRDLDGLLDDAVKIDILPGFRYGINDRWTVIAGAIVEFAGEPDADVGDSATYGGFGGARYAFSDNFALTLGAGVKSRLEDNVQVLPFIGLEWKINEQFRLTSRGPGLNLAAKVSETVAATIGFQYESRDYRLDDDHEFFGEGVARDTRFPIRVGVEWAPSKLISVEAFTGVVVWQEFEFLDRDGQKQFETNSDPAPFVGINCSIKF
jgi:opacity protein-like surface antigen